MARQSSTDAPGNNDEEETPAVEAQPEVDADEGDDIVIDEEIVAPDDDAVVVLGEVEEEDEEEEEAEAEVAVAAVAPPPTPRPQPGRPPSAKEEPPPPFAIGERIILISNTRPRTGTPIGNYPVGSGGRVETVLSQTAIVRFDIAPDTKEVVAFTCLESAEKTPDGKPKPPPAAE